MAEVQVVFRFQSARVADGGRAFKAENGAAAGGRACRLRAGEWGLAVTRWAQWCGFAA